MLNGSIETEIYGSTDPTAEAFAFKWSNVYMCVAICGRRENRE